MSSTCHEPACDMADTVARQRMRSTSELGRHDDWASAGLCWRTRGESGNLGPAASKDETWDVSGRQTRARESATCNTRLGGWW